MRWKNPLREFASREFHDCHMNHRGHNGHACVNHDGCWICDDCPEASTCECFSDKPLACAPLIPTTQKLQSTDFVL